MSKTAIRACDWVPLTAVLVRAILAGEVLHARPVDGKIVVDNETVPARP